MALIGPQAHTLTAPITRTGGRLMFPYLSSTLLGTRLKLTLFIYSADFFLCFTDDASLLLSQKNPSNFPIYEFNNMNVKK